MRRAFFAALLLATWGCRRRVPEAMTALPDFSMTAVGAKTETPFGLKDMRGKVWLADFIFTTCGGPCPLLSQRLARLAQGLPPQVRLLSVTVDPETDTPEVLREYAAAFGADLSHWVFLRGTAEQTYRLVYAGFRQTMSTDPGAAPAARVTHGTKFVLVDKKGGIRGFYDGLSDLDNAAAARDARRLLEEGS